VDQLSYFKIHETRWTKSWDVSFFFMPMKFHTSQHPMKIIFKLSDALMLDIKKCQKEFQQGHKHPTQTTLLLNFNILSCQCQNFMTCQITVPKLLASSTVLMPTHTLDLSPNTTADKANAWPSTVLKSVPY
jgi:hypothetical protein